MVSPPLAVKAEVRARVRGHVSPAGQRVAAHPRRQAFRTPWCHATAPSLSRVGSSQPRRYDDAMPEAGAAGSRRQLRVDAFPLAVSHAGGEWRFIDGHVDVEHAERALSDGPDDTRLSHADARRTVNDGIVTSASLSTTVTACPARDCAIVSASS